ncbi:MAG: AraC family transcriptional regulator [Tannerellaceae bacterium]|jgi:AraC-like DNA-binding protein|nr:AraC family transcriptional regulator [Tannerellaceae bacterium]
MNSTNNNSRSRFNTQNAEAGMSDLTIGFRNHKLKEREKYQSEYGNCNQIIYLIKGNLIIYSNEILGKEVKTGEIFFLPISSVLSCEALTPCNFLIVYFNRFINQCEVNFAADLSAICDRNKFTFHTINIRPPLLAFIRNTIASLKQLDGYKEFHQLKYEELFYVLRLTYEKKELAPLLHTVAGRSVEFRMFILDQYLKVKSISELVHLSGMKRKTFDRQFQEEFEDTPYHWILTQKSKHVLYALSETNDKMQTIMAKYGFNIPPHFTRFCKDYFNYPPMALRRQLRLQRNTGRSKK